MRGGTPGRTHPPVATQCPTTTRGRPRRLLQSEHQPVSQDHGDDANIHHEPLDQMTFDEPVDLLGQRAHVADRDLQSRREPPARWSPARNVSRSRISPLVVTRKKSVWCSFRKVSKLSESPALSLQRTIPEIRVFSRRLSATCRNGAEAARALHRYLARVRRTAADCFPRCRWATMTMCRRAVSGWG